MTDEAPASAPAVTSAPVRASSPAAYAYRVVRPGYGHPIGAELSASEVAAAHQRGNLDTFAVRVKG
ncbi:hypothetical protein AAJCM20276_27140 [Acetobacter aceti]|uniref:Uncharacterized protein n=1 Tax=Acetobacter aceti TaxID=435 RepID=A0A6S6PM14_ACEAC|nr:hypothetical protein [Acetobacter aceti]BCI68090.1 hypothetical protein AAJCM20276_27140 [Acetobacter aceti]